MGATRTRTARPQGKKTIDRTVQQTPEAKISERSTVIHPLNLYHV